jgi:hypothetical protein
VYNTEGVYDSVRLRLGVSVTCVYIIWKVYMTVQGLGYRFHLCMCIIENVCVISQGLGYRFPLYACIIGAMCVRG